VDRCLLSGINEGKAFRVISKLSWGSTIHFKENLQKQFNFERKKTNKQKAESKLN